MTDTFLSKKFIYKEIQYSLMTVLKLVFLKECFKHPLQYLSLQVRMNTNICQITFYDCVLFT